MKKAKDEYRQNVIFKGKYGDMQTIVVDQRDRDFGYNDVQCINLHLYDGATGNPINEEVEKMDKAFYDWDINEFRILFNKLNDSDYYIE